MPQPNILAVVLAAAAAVVLGALWYAPFLFGRLWRRLAGITSTRGAVLSYLLNFLSMLLMSYVLGSILKGLEAGTIAAGLTIAFWLWAGLVATITLGSLLWERKPLALYILNNAYNLLSLMLISLIHVLLP
jgi:glucan phosphoethanolaminetransferase (alkaline phosphatase superfamily)